MGLFTFRFGNSSVTVMSEETSTNESVRLPAPYDTVCGIYICHLSPGTQISGLDCVQSLTVRLGIMHDKQQQLGRVQRSSLEANVDPGESDTQEYTKQSQSPIQGQKQINTIKRQLVKLVEDQ